MKGILFFLVSLLSLWVSSSQLLRRAVAAGQVTFADYMTYNEVVEYLHALQQRYPKVVKLGSAGTSVEGRPLVYARLSLGGANNPIMLVDALMHAREWITLPAALYLLQRVLEKNKLPSGLDLVVVPIVNPDGYEYSRTKDRMWRKNRAATYNRTCTGVDLNRNFDYHWADFKSAGGASSDPCDLMYAGPNAASEPETRGYQSFVRSLNAEKRLTMYVNMHNPEKTKIATEANAAMVKAGSKAYTVENMAADYPATGTVTDWVRGVAGVAQSFCLELPPGGSNDQLGFAVPASSILPVSRQVYKALQVFAKYAKAPLTQ